MEDETKKYIGVKTNLFGYNGDVGTIDRFYPSYGETGQFRITYEHDKYISWVNKERVIEALSKPEFLLCAVIKNEVAVCDRCLGRGSIIIYDTCLDCEKCEGNGTQTVL